VGWAMHDHMRAELTIAALTMAIQRQKPPPGLIHHSDRQSAKPLDPVSKKSGEGHFGLRIGGAVRLLFTDLRRAAL
jgi:transposase InsO family protein